MQGPIRPWLDNEFIAGKIREVHRVATIGGTEYLGEIEPPLSYHGHEHVYMM